MTCGTASSDFLVAIGLTALWILIGLFFGWLFILIRNYSYGKEWDSDDTGDLIFFGFLMPMAVLYFILSLIISPMRYFLNIGKRLENIEEQLDKLNRRRK